MVTKNVDNRWIRRYKAFFIVGFFILIFQLFLAIRFFALNNDSVPQAVHIWSPHKTWKSDAGEAENSVNSARKSKDGLVLDDEDLKFNEKQIKFKKASDRNQFSNKTNLKLRLEELDFMPSCEITGREAISAIHRAKTQKCKQEISNITCLIQQNSLYPASLPNYCSSNGFVKGKALGCFKDEKNYRLLSGYYGINKKGNSPEYCINLCLQSGFPYAGVQYSTECFCGNDEPSSTEKLPDSSCNMKCPSDPHLACGGYYAINVYQTGITKFIPQLAEIVATENQVPVKIAFLLTLNGRALRQVKRLIKNLFHRDHYYFIHVDVRQDYLFRELLSLEKQFPNIKLTRRRFATIWGGASLLEMLLSAMQELLQINWNWDFVINLSESDYPVKTLSRLVTFLSANRDKNFVKSHGREVQRFIQKQGLDKTFVECDIHMWRIGDRRLPWGIQIDGGSDWIALSRKFVSYIVKDSPDDLVKGLFLVFKYTLLPAESFFHTVLRNSKFCDTYVDNNLHVTNWKRKLGCKCQYKHVVDWCGCSPNDFKPEDWLRIQNTESRQLFFARKFEPIINQDIILQLEQWLYKTDYVTRIPNINSYWQNIYNNLDLGTPIDDGLFTISHSIARITSKNLSSNTCAISPHKILEVSSYHLNDSYQSTLTLFEAITPHYGKVILETALKLRKQFSSTPTSEFSSRIKYLFVSSDYDPKEQVSRNFGRILGPYSDPVLIYEFNASPDSSAKYYNVSFLWLDPAGHLIEISELIIEENLIQGHIKPSLKQPLLPGIWSVKLVHKYQELAKVKFLILPLEYYSGSSVSPNQVHFIHSGTGLHKEFDPQWDEFLPAYVNQERLEQLSVSNSKRFGPDLQEWIDTLVNKFYTAGDVCVKRGSVCGKIIPECHSTNWSSLAPDPKSYIGKVNETTGMFDLW